MDMLDRIANKVFPRRTLDDIIKDRLEKAVVEERQAAHVILTHRFQRYMARNEIEGLKRWDMENPQHETEVQ